jgi:hypothetical protein
MTAMAFWMSSMYRDLAKSRRVEADEIIGDLDIFDLRELLPCSRRTRLHPQ